MDTATLLGPYGLTVALLGAVAWLNRESNRWRDLYLEARTRNDQIPQLLAEQTAAFVERDRERDAAIETHGQRIDALTRGIRLLADMRPSERPGAYRQLGEGGQ